MESDNNIKDFFEKRLLDENPEAADWNMPSDDIWESALPHFPKEKKKKRPFFFFLTGAGILALALVIGFYFSFKTNTSSAITITTNKPLANPITESKNKAAEIKTVITPTKTIAETTENKKINSNKTISITENNQKENFTKNESKKSLIDSHSQKNNFKEETKINANIEVDLPVNNLEATKKTDKTLNENIEKETIIPLPILNQENPLVDAVAKNELAKELGTLPILIPEVIGENKETYEQTTIIPIKQKRQLKKWEIGLSHAPFIINWRNLITADSLEEGEEINFTINYKNINLPISRRLGRRWSLSSGIALSRLNACIDYYANNITYDANQTNPDWTGSLRSQTNGTFINTNTLEEFEIDISSDVNLIDGDSLELMGKVPVKLSFVQVPIVFNFHFGKKRLEGLIHGGINLNYLHESVNNVDFSLLKHNQIISEETDIDPYNAHYFAVLPIFGIGTKYHFTDHFNIGVSAKIELFAPILSRFEIGAYYSF